MPRLRTVATAGLVSLMVACVTAHVKITSESEGDARKHNIDAISAVLAPKLPALLKLLETRRRLLHPSADGLSYPAVEVEALLSDLERPLLGAFEDEDVAALRDLIADRFAQVRKDLKLPRAASIQSHEVRLAAFRWAGDDSPRTLSVDRAATESGLDRLMRLIGQLIKLSTDKDLAVDLCVVSQPTGAGFSMNAPSLPGKPYGTMTVGRVVSVSRGYYGYKITQGALKYECPAPKPGGDWPCVAIDLWDDSQLVLDCDLSQKDPCRRRALKKGECKEATP